MPDVLIGGLAGQGPKGHITLAGALAIRHGLVAGATGTGKTVTLQVLAEEFSRMGVPVFTADVKGDLSGIAAAGNPHPRVDERLASLGINDWQPQAAPVRLWDLFGKSGYAVRAGVASMGPELMSPLLELNDTQSGLMHLAFDHAEREGLELIDLKDLISLLKHIEREREGFEERYGSVSPQCLGAMLRRVHVLATQGGERFFAEPALDINDMLATTGEGVQTRGFINLLDGRELMQSPRLYTTFLLWFLSTLFRTLPERGDADRPVLVFFFDEAHLLFEDAPKALVDKVEQVARLIRSKGVGIYFITQNPADVPEDILGQLGNRIQHALRAFTARDRKNLRLAAETYRDNPRFETEDAIREVGVGEAVTSMLQKKGVPGVVERTLIRPPSSQLGPITAAERGAFLQESDMGRKYGERLDRRSAYEILTQRAEASAQEAEKAEEEVEELPAMEREYRAARRYSGSRVSRSSSRITRKKDTFASAMSEAVIKELKGTTGRRLVRGILGGLFKGR